VGEGSTKSGGEESKSISSELASAINDGLYFYEQVDAFVILIFIIS
jgi:la-related protein 1